MEENKSPGHEALIYKPTKVSWALHSVVMRKESRLDRNFFYFLILSICLLVLYGFIAQKAIVIDTQGTIINSSNPRPVSSEAAFKVEKILIQDNKQVKKGDIILYGIGYLEPAEMEIVQKRLTIIGQILTVNREEGFKRNAELEQINSKVVLNGIKAVVDDQIIAEAVRLQNLVNRYLQASKTFINLPLITNNLSYKIKSTKIKIFEIEKRKAQEMLATEYEELKSQLIELEATLSDRKLNTERELDSVESELAVELQSFTSKLKKKNDSMIFIAQTDGIIRYNELTSQGQLISPGTIIYYIVQNESEFVAELKIQNRDISKVQKNQEVKLDIEAFPASEYGIQTGRISEINQKIIKKEENNNAREFVAIVKLDNQYISHGDKKIYGIRNGMVLSAKVVTKYEKMIAFVIKKLLQIKDEYIGD